LDISVLIQRKTLIVTLRGELDHHSAGNVKELLEELIKNRGPENLIFDFTNLTFMDSSGVGMLIGRYKLISAIGGKVCICGASRTVDRLLTMSGIKKIIATYQTAEDALNRLEEVVS